MHLNTLCLFHFSLVYIDLLFLQNSVFTVSVSVDPSTIFEQWNLTFFHVVLNTIFWVKNSGCFNLKTLSTPLGFYNRNQSLVLISLGLTSLGLIIWPVINCRRRDLTLGLHCLMEPIMLIGKLAWGFIFNPVIGGYGEWLRMDILLPSGWLKSGFKTSLQMGWERF